jgi:hypothetical protein
MENQERRFEGQEMTESETIAFLQEHRVAPLENWVPHQPLLYVLEERTRPTYEGRTPSIVRLNDPIKIEFDNPLSDDDEPDRIVYALHNAGGQLDYYAINPLTKKIEQVHTTLGRDKAGAKPYHVRKEGLYVAADELFPPSKE